MILPGLSGLSRKWPSASLATPEIMVESFGFKATTAEPGKTFVLSVSETVPLRVV